MANICMFENNANMDFESRPVSRFIGRGSFVENDIKGQGHTIRLFGKFGTGLVTICSHAI